MDNQAFRRLVGDTPRQPQKDGSPSSTKPQAALLGSRLKSSIPMTPRSVGGHGNSTFARQLAESRASGQPQKKFKAMAAPRGVKLAKGYQDRAASRAEMTEDEREARIKALEEQVKLGQIEQTVFEQLRDEITGGDVGATHLVKGLDMKLLERVRRGEDVFNNTPKPGDGEEHIDTEGPSLDEDQEFDKLEQQGVARIEREKISKKGEMAPPPLPVPVAGVKRSRNDILAELRAQRQAAAESKASEASRLGSKFKKLGGKGQESSRIERDEHGREVLITVDENGKVKRKVRKIAVEEKPKGAALPMPDKNQKPLGMEVPRLPTPPPPEENDDDDDIFEGVGDSYDPLGAAENDDDADSDSDDAEDKVSETEKPSEAQVRLNSQESKQASSPLPQPKRNYFNEVPSTAPAEAKEKTAPFQDPTILAALKRAAALEKRSTENNEARSAEEPQKSTAAQRLLGTGRDRDYDDLDMGFGGSRGEDEDDGEDGAKIKLSQWKGAGADDEDDEDDGKGGKQRKRGKKKRKGDKNSAADVMKVIASRK